MVFMVMPLAESTFEKYILLILPPIWGKTSGTSQCTKEEIYADLSSWLDGVTKLNHFPSLHKTPAVSPFTAFIAARQ